MALIIINYVHLSAFSYIMYFLKFLSRLFMGGGLRETNNE